MVNHTEDRRIGADPQRQCYHRESREPRMLEELATRKPQILAPVPEPFQRVKATRATVAGPRRVFLELGEVSQAA